MYRTVVSLGSILKTPTVFVSLRLLAIFSITAVYIPDYISAAACNPQSQLDDWNRLALPSIFIDCAEFQITSTQRNLSSYNVSSSGQLYFACCA